MTSSHKGAVARLLASQGLSFCHRLDPVDISCLQWGQSKALSELTGRSFQSHDVEMH